MEFRQFLAASCPNVYVYECANCSKLQFYSVEEGKLQAAPPMITPEQCRAYAAECRRMAELAASPEQKAILLELANEWDISCKQTEKWEQQRAAAARKPV
jgi:hypothetical protein